MSVERKLLDFDNNELFVSSRILQFILDNALQTILSDDFSKITQGFRKEYELYQCKESTYPLDALIKLLEICRKANASNDQYYTIGNRVHDLHVLISSLLNQNIPKTIDWSNQLNLIKLSLIESQNTLTIKVELNKIIFIDHKKKVEPILSLLKGFFGRIFSNFFSTTTKEEKIKNGFSLTYTRSTVSSFDFMKFIRNEEFVFSRIKNFLDQTQEESFEDRVCFFLFRDIKFSIEEIASKLNMSVRSLQRSMKDEGSSFRSIKENVRKELSLRYLQDKPLSIHEVSMLLGYSERGAFEKAFRKWYGKNPSEYRKSLS